METAVDNLEDRTVATLVMPEVQAREIQNIIRYGWAARVCFCKESRHKVCYETVGFQQSYDMPDIQILCPDKVLCHEIANKVVAKVKHGIRLREGTRLRSIFPAGSDAYTRGFMGLIVAITDVPKDVMLRLVLPDRNGKLDKLEIMYPHQSQWANVSSSAEDMRKLQYLA